MCRDASPSDLARSRWRWFDFPALLLLHRPIRCRMCDDRSYSVRFSKRLTILPWLWMHYVALVVIAVATFWVFEKSGWQPFSMKKDVVRSTVEFPDE